HAARAWNRRLLQREMSCRHSVSEHAAACSGVERIAPQRLHREGLTFGCDNHCGRSLTRRNPRAFIAIFRALPIQPPAIRKLVGDRLRHLMSTHNRDSRIRTEAVEVSAT